MSAALVDIKGNLKDLDAAAVGRLARKAAAAVADNVRARRRSRRDPNRTASGRTLRFAYGRIAQETNALSPLKTTRHDFERAHFLCGDALAAACVWGAAEADGFMKNAELSGFVDGVKEAVLERDLGLTLLPLVSAWAVPSGPLTLACFESLVEDLLRPLRAALADGPLDGVFLSLHGAMNVDDLPLSARETPESEIVRRVRALVGDDAFIGVTLDLHGNLVPGLVERSDVIQAYRTNPHRDHADVGRRVGRLLVRAAAREIQPVMAWRSLPMILGGGNTLDFGTPLRSIFRRMDELEENDAAVLGASVLTVHPWNAHVELGWATLVVTDGDRHKAEAHADDLADRTWAVRTQLPPTFSTPTEAIAEARAAHLRRKTGVVLFADASDVVTAGAAGESTALVRALVEDAQGLTCYVPLRDPTAVAALWQHKPGDAVSLPVGGTFDPARNTPLVLSGTLVSLPRSHGVDRMAVVRVGTVFVLLVEGPCLAIRPAFFENAGLRVRKADVVVVKNFFPFLVFFAPYSRMVRFVKTAGVTDFDAAFALPFAGPIHPKDDVSEWRSADARRRAPPPGAARATQQAA